MISHGQQWRLALAALVACAPAARPASLWDDRPARIVQAVEARFPPGLMQQGIHAGEVRAIMLIEADGNLADCLVSAYTHRELADELLSALRGWRYEPARHRGENVGSRTEVVFTFQARGAVLALTAADAIVAPRFPGSVAQPLTHRVCSPDELDQPVSVIHTVAPLHPGRVLEPAQPDGTAAIDFYIDAEGRPRMPATLRATHPAFAAAAIDALMHWRFATPTRHGEPIAVRVVQQFVFSSHSS